MRYKAETEALRLAPMADRLNLGNGDMPAYQATLAAADAVADLARQLELPYRLRDVGVPEDTLEIIATEAAGQLGEDPDGVLRVTRST